jgi:hypothetical protein
MSDLIKKIQKNHWYCIVINGKHIGYHGDKS